MGHFNGTFITKKVGEITLSFVEYSASKSIKLIPDIVEYKAGASEPLYDLIIGKQTLHDIGAVLDLKEKTITIDSTILLPMRNIVNLQLKPSVTRALKHNTSQAQEPVSTQNATNTKRVIEILDAKWWNQRHRRGHTTINQQMAATATEAAAATASAMATAVVTAAMVWQWRRRRRWQRQRRHVRSTLKRGRNGGHVSKDYSGIFRAKTQKCFGKTLSVFICWACSSISERNYFSATAYRKDFS